MFCDTSLVVDSHYRLASNLWELSYFEFIGCGSGFIDQMHDIKIVGIAFALGWFSWV